MKNQGFTLLEIMIVIAIVGLVVAIAAPRYQDLKKSASFKEGVRTVYATLKDAKIHAIKRNRTVQISFADHTCTVSSDDDADDNDFETILRTVFVDEEVFIRNVDFSGNNFIRFNSIGFARNFAGSLEIQLDSRRRFITVSESGDIEVRVNNE